MSDDVNGLVDYYLKRIVDEHDDDDDDIVPMTMRIPSYLKIQLEVVAEFLGLSRNALCTEFLEFAADQAMKRIDSPEGPMKGSYRINDMTAFQMYVKALNQYKAEGKEGVSIGGTIDQLPSRIEGWEKAS